MSELATLLQNLLVLFGIALAVRILVQGRDRVAYASVLVAVGFLASVFRRPLHIELTHEIILFLFLPAIIFAGTIELEAHEFWRDRWLIGFLTVIGLPLAVGILGGVGTVAFGFSLPIALIFAAVILPTDPAAVISIFEEFDVTERLAVAIESESLLNDGVAIVIFSTLLGLYQTANESVTDIATTSGVVGFAGDIAVVGGGGLVVGFLIGFVADALIHELKDDRSILMLTVIVAYGSFLLAEHYLHMSGVLATVGAGMLLGGEEETDPLAHMGELTHDVWDTVGWLVSTALYILIGSAVHLPDFVEHARLVVLAAILVVVVRAVTIYPLVNGANLIVKRTVPLRYQHIMVWGGLHTVVPVALVLSLPSSIPQKTTLETMVFGVAIISIVVQGLLMPRVLELSGLADGSA